MKTGYGEPGRFQVIAVLALVIGAFAPGLAQTDTTAEQCAADSLILLSPDENGLSVRLSEPGTRFGAYLKWAEPPDSTSTCKVITSSEQLPFTVELEGDYADHVDRVIEFFTLDNGVVGSQEVNRLLFRWTNIFVSRSGRVEGTLNLSNSGGVLRLDREAAWDRVNDGLPFHLPYTNILTLAQSPLTPDHLLLHMGGSSSPGSDPRGLLEKTATGGWTRISEHQFPDGFLITKLAISPAADDDFAVGSAEDGLFLTTDGGETYANFTDELAPEHPSPPAFFEVTALNWSDAGDLYASVRAFGFFVSGDGGESFEQLENLLVPQYIEYPDSTRTFPFVNQIVVDPADPSHLFVAVKKHALYQSLDGGATWEAATGDWIVPGEGWEHNGRSVAINPNNGQVIIVGTNGKGIWRTTNGGAHWDLVGAELAPDSVWTGRAVVGVTYDPLAAGAVFAVVDGLGLLHSTDSGATWSMYGQQPTNVSNRELLVDRDGSGALLLASYGGGVYEAGAPLELSKTINRGFTAPEYRDLELGLSISFSSGQIDSGTVFRAHCQDFQGYAVWRSGSDAPFNMELIGVFDKTNPESCIEGFCGDENFTITPSCFGERRAACFDFSEPDSVVFFDNNIYNGFTYYYAVSTFDYGSTAGIEPPALARDQLFSPRFPSTISETLNLAVSDDPDSPFWGRGNLSSFQVNIKAEGPVDGEEIYVYPNPLRRGTGFPGKEGEQVVFTHLPPESQITVYTVDGDLVADLGPDLQKDANLYWVTRNEDGELLGSGIYIWKVEMPQRGDFYGKLIIIR